MLLNLLKFLFGLTLFIFVGACATVRDDYPTPEPSFASQPGPDGPFADLEAAFVDKHGTQNSGFILLANGAEALNWLLTLIDEARHSLDMQYYQWYGDDSGELGEKLARLMESYMEPQNSWRVRMDDGGNIVWQSGDEILERQPARNFWQRSQDVFFKLFPKEQF